MPVATRVQWMGLVSALLLGGACKKENKPAAGKPAADGGAASGSGSASDAAVAAAASPDAAPTARPVTGYTGKLAASIPLDGGATLWFGFGEDEEITDVAGLDKLVVRLERDGKPVWQRDGFLAISDHDTVPAMFENCDSIMSAIVKQSWGEASGARLSVACRAGEDFFSATELAILLELDAALTEPFPPMWSGDADTLRSENDECIMTTTVTFKVAGTEMTRTEVDEAEGCKRKKAKRTTKVTVPRRAAGAPGALPAALTKISDGGAMGFEIDDTLTTPSDASLVVKTVDPEHVEVWVGQDLQLRIRVEGGQKIIAEIEVVGRLPRLEHGLGVGSKASELAKALGEPALVVGDLGGHPYASWEKLGPVEVRFASKADAWPALVAEDAVVTSINVLSAGEGEGEED